MSLLNRWIPAYTEVDEDQARALASPSTSMYSVEVRPPKTESVPATVEGFVRGILEIQTRLLGAANSSPILSYEVQRPQPQQLRFVLHSPTKRVERKIRTHLSNQIPGIGFDEGSTGLPVAPEDSIGGGILTTGRKDRYPLRTEFDTPPTNSLSAALHRHAMRDTKTVVQVLFQPIVGHPVREWWASRRAYKTVGYLRKEKEQLWGSRSPTPREQSRADAVERKTAVRQYWVSIRFAVIGAGEYTASRVKEIAGAFNIYENPDSGQYLDAVTIRAIRQKRFLELYQAIKERRFGGYSLRFRASAEELAGLLSVPSREQENISYSQP